MTTAALEVVEQEEANTGREESWRGGSFQEGWGRRKKWGHRKDVWVAEERGGVMGRQGRKGLKGG